jgi:hypothetical protein
VRVSVKAAQKGTYSTGVWLMEDGIYAIQQDYNGIADQSYNIHDNCVRYVDDTCVNKAHKMGFFKSGETRETVFVINVNSSWSIDDLHFAVTVSELDDNGRDYTVCNAIDCTINEVVPFEYK